ncbi:MAG: isoprenylcysteine carboxylmethyltransferase family protein [Mycobacteriaceae bacterium]|nr:isoprenylcysteine carboxylmethyltransferase family protein [Mycobacteriaceae bacterium]
MGIVVRAALQSILGIGVFGALLFITAGTFDYWQAWVFLAVFTIASIFSGAYFLTNDPAAVDRRMRSGPGAESRPVQKVVAAGIYVLVAALLVVSALDHRFGWSRVPVGIALIGDALAAGGLGIAILTLFQNRYGSANVTVEQGQKLVSTGLYGVVRHPMYLGAMIMMTGMPLALDSWWGLILLVPALVGISFRIRDEEEMLTRELAGYRAYTGEVHYRLLPYVW